MSREHAVEAQDERQEAVTGSLPAAATPAAAFGLDPLGVLALQRRIGNAAVGRVLARQVAEAPAAPAATGPATWTRDQIKPIQRELRRLRLYDLSIDGILGFRSDQGLTEAFGGDEWRSMAADEALARLRSAKRPRDGGGRNFRYAELFKDGVFDATFGIGFGEGIEAHMAGIESRVAEALRQRGYEEKPKRAAELLATANRPLQGAFGRFFVKENAFTYSPPAGASRSIHSVVRVVHNSVPGAGGAARDAFREGMLHGDATWYIGHGRYGTGPDFDRNFIRFTLRDKPDGEVRQVIDDYGVLEHELRREGDPWTVFKRRVAAGTLTADLSNAGNLRLNASTGKPKEFGGRLIQWALEQTDTPVETGAKGALGQDAATAGRRYRVVGFYGCSTADYERALRDTKGFGTKEADLFVTNRTTRTGAEVQAFLTFIDGLIGQASAQAVLSDLNKEMRSHENKFTTDPFQVTGTADNPHH